MNANRDNPLYYLEIRGKGQPGGRCCYPPLSPQSSGGGTIVLIYPANRNMAVSFLLAFQININSNDLYSP